MKESSRFNSSAPYKELDSAKIKSAMPSARRPVMFLPLNRRFCFSDSSTAIYIIISRVQQYMQRYCLENLTTPFCYNYMS